MSSADLYTDDFPHGSRAGYDQGCRGAACPFRGDPEFLSCREAWVLRQGDYTLRSLAEDHVFARTSTKTTAAKREATWTEPEPVRATPIHDRPQRAPKPAPPKTATPRPAAIDEARAPVPTPSSIEVVPPAPAKWSIRRVWVAIDQAGVMHGPFDDQPAALRHALAEPALAVPAPTKRAMHRWLPEHDEILRTMWADRQSDVAIAQAIGCSHGSVGNHREALGLQRNFPGRPRTATTTKGPARSA